MTLRYELAPRVGHPLQVRWATHVGEHVDFTPVRVADVVVVAAGARLLALDVATGTVRWREHLRGHVRALATAAGTAVATVSEGNVWMVGYDAAGTRLWKRNDGFSSGLGGLRASEGKILVLGVPPGLPPLQTCRVLDPRSGNVLHELELDAFQVPHLVGERLVYGAQEGLFATQFDGRTQRLHASRCCSLAVVDGTALFADADKPPRQLIAVDLATGGERWRAPDAGPFSALSIDRGDFAATLARSSQSFAPVLRDLETGEIRWEGPPVEARDAVLTLSADLVLMQVDVTMLQVHDRRTGALLQRIDRISGLHSGLCSTERGAIDSRARRIECLSDGEPSPDDQAHPSAPEPAAWRDDPPVVERPAEQRWSEAYLLEVAAQLDWWFHPAELRTADPAIQGRALKTILDELGAQCRPSLALPEQLERKSHEPDSGPAVEGLRREVARVRAAGRQVYGRAPWRPWFELACVTDWPLQVTGAPCLEDEDRDRVVLVELSDMPEHADAWRTRFRLNSFTAVEALSLQGNALIHELGIDVSALPRLRLLDLGRNWLMRVPDEVLACRGLEYLDLSDNEELGPNLDPSRLVDVGALRFLGLRGTNTPKDTLAALRHALPTCEIDT